jgi:hypothetical protein
MMQARITVEEYERIMNMTIDVAAPTPAISIPILEQERQLAKQAYEDTFHKIPATIGFDDWFLAWQKCLKYHITK